jgi:signal transduction histidine kinase/CheY-like chemotaxis protein/HPt (histidine-containing phosphotransfer) domain-containing protein
MLRNFRIGTRLILSFFIIVFFALAIGITGFLSLTSLGNMAVKSVNNVNILNDIYDDHAAIDAGLFGMIYITDASLTDYAVQRTNGYKEALLNRLKDYLKIQDQFNDIFTPGEMQDMINLFEIYEEAYIPVMDEIFDLAEQGRREEALSIYVNRVTPIYDSFTYYINRRFSGNLLYSLTETSKNNESASLGAYLMMAVVLLSLVVSIVLALAVTKSIAVPLSALGEAAEKLAKGDINVQLEQSQSNDEIAHLSLRLSETLQYIDQAQRLKLEAVEARHEKEKALAASRAKGDFLAKMSHEIRTPMNAISGMAELLLRRDLPAEAKAEVCDIKQASSNLISIINDILDFSKIEAGKLDIVPVKYMLSSLVNDTINIIRMRLMEKPIRFFTNIDGSIPNSLIGDEIRMRQILLNLLSNAAKYTEKGHIRLTITMQKREGKQVWLEIIVADSGKGIKFEDQEKLFGSFVQVDSKENRSIEGTGLGLAITKQLCLAMNGDITLQSEYGKGSEFKVTIPQGFSSGAPFAAVEEPEKKKVLVYEERIVYSKSICWSLENMGVPYVMTETHDDFSRALLREEWYYVFSCYELYEKIKPTMENVTKEKKPPLALMVEWENEAHIPNVRFISLPVQSLSIANVLNGKADSRDYFSSRGSGLIRFTYPGARLLIVDDLPTNLKVAEGLLTPYHVKIDTVLSGAKAIEKVIQNKYDIVFMDHMMPEMDGIEATAAIREWEASSAKQATSASQQAIPIVALTANAVSGMKEIFIEKGFSDFLAKPIDISKLNEILDHWIPREKRGVDNENLSTGTAPKKISAGTIHGVDIEKGLFMTGGTMEIYRQVLDSFREDVEERLPSLQNAPDTGAMPGFINHVHALKSASASIGAVEISSKAEKLEAAGKAGDIDFIRENLPGFAKHLAELINNIAAFLSKE